MFDIYAALGGKIRFALLAKKAIKVCAGKNHSTDTLGAGSLVAILALAALGGGMYFKFNFEPSGGLRGFLTKTQTL